MAHIGTETTETSCSRARWWAPDAWPASYVICSRTVRTFIAGTDPFSRAVIAFAPPIDVRADAGREEMARKHSEMQAALERVRDLAESWFTLSSQARDRHRTEWNA